MELRKLTRNFHDAYLESLKVLEGDIQLIILADEGKEDYSYIGVENENYDEPSKWKRSKLTFHNIKHLKIDKFEDEQSILDFLVTDKHVHIYTQNGDSKQGFFSYDFDTDSFDFEYLDKDVKF